MASLQERREADITHNLPGAQVMSEICCKPACPNYDAYAVGFAMHHSMLLRTVHRGCSQDAPDSIGGLTLDSACMVLCLSACKRDFCFRCFKRVFMSVVGTSAAGVWDLPQSTCISPCYYQDAYMHFQPKQRESLRHTAVLTAEQLPSW